jgi:hypothetical protein
MKLEINANPWREYYSNGKLAMLQFMVDESKLFAEENCEFSTDFLVEMQRFFSFVRRFRHQRHLPPAASDLLASQNQISPRADW